MDRFLRIATPVILLGLALLVWLEPLLRNESATPWLGETGVLRFALGMLCLYLILVVVEQQRVGAAFKEVLSAFRRFHDERQGSGRSPGNPQREAIGLLVGALSSTDPSIRGKAAQHLARLTGRDFGEDPDRWRRWLGESGLGESGLEEQGPEPPSH